MGPRITHFCHQWGRHPTVLHIRGGARRRISARFSPDRSHPLNLNFFWAIFDNKKAKTRIFWEGFAAKWKGPGPWGPMGPYGALGEPWGAHGALGGGLGGPYGP